ncbi:hypothetical protein BMS3Abin03_00519 [bacterium BMS3Abin03]|nr:hypothetical protein BMS3Abin03_00519 [bacterium BMS3Abin03]
MRDYYPHFPVSFISGFYHMANKSPVAFALWRYASPEAVVFISCRVKTICCLVFFLILIINLAPFIKTEGRVGNNSIKLHKGITFFKFRITDSIPPAYSSIIKSVKKHIHHCKSPGTAISFLSIE